jgi:hypothetical protein
MALVRPERRLYQKVQSTHFKRHCQVQQMTCIKGLKTSKLSRGGLLVSHSTAVPCHLGLFALGWSLACPLALLCFPGSQVSWLWLRWPKGDTDWKKAEAGVLIPFLSALDYFFPIFLLSRGLWVLGKLFPDWFYSLFSLLWNNSLSWVPFILSVHKSFYFPGGPRLTYIFLKDWQHHSIFPPTSPLTIIHTCCHYLLIYTFLSAILSKCLSLQELQT